MAQSKTETPTKVEPKKETEEDKNELVGNFSNSIYLTLKYLFSFQSEEDKQLQDELALCVERLTVS